MAMEPVGPSLLEASQTLASQCEAFEKKKTKLEEQLELKENNMDGLSREIYQMCERLKKLQTQADDERRNAHQDRKQLEKINSSVQTLKTHMRQLDGEAKAADEREKPRGPEAQNTAKPGRPDGAKRDEVPQKAQLEKGMKPVKKQGDEVAKEAAKEADDVALINPQKRDLDNKEQKKP